MAGIPRNKYDLLPYFTTLSPPSSSSDRHSLNFTHHRPSKREYIESSDAEDTSSSPPRKIYRRPKRREWRDSSDIAYSSDVDDDDIRRIFEKTEDVHRHRTRTVAVDDKREDVASSQASQESSTSKFHRILNAAIMDGLDSIDFSECGLYELPGDIGELKHLVRSSALQHEAPLIPELKVFLGTGNHLTSLPFELFTLTNLTVLSLCMCSSWRQLILGNNKLRVLPQAIGNLISLRELNLTGNQLSYLPHTVLELKHLQHLRLHANPFLPPPASYAPLPTPPSSQAKTPAILRAHQCPSRPNGISLVPSFVEFTSRVLASNFIVAEINKTYEIPEYISSILRHAEQRYQSHDTCAICGKWYVNEPVDERGIGCIEWYDSLHTNDAVPIWRGACSWGCIVRWNEQCEEILNEGTKYAKE